MRLRPLGTVRRSLTLRRSGWLAGALSLVTVFAFGVLPTRGSASSTASEACPGAYGKVTARHGSSISFVRNGDVWLVRTRGGHGSVVLRGRDSGPSDSHFTYFGQSWSPNGWLAVECEGTPTGTHGYDEILVWHGSQYETLSGPTVISGNPSWAPDGKRLVFVSYDTGYGGKLQIGSPSSYGGFGRDVIPEDRDKAYDNSPSWSPNGKEIAFARTLFASCDPVVDPACGEKDITQIWLVQPNGHNLHQLSTGTEDDHPSWSPDSARIVFSNQQGIATINADGTDFKQFTDDGGTDPAWSPGGGTIAYDISTDTSTDWEIRLLNLANRHQRTLVANGSSPAWTPR